MRGKVLVVCCSVLFIASACEQPIVLSDWDDPTTFSGKTVEFEDDTSDRIRSVPGVTVSCSPVTGTTMTDVDGRWAITLTARQQPLVFTLTAPGYDTAYHRREWWMSGMIESTPYILMTRPVTDAPPTVTASLDTTGVSGDSVVLRVTASSPLRESQVSVFLTVTPDAPRDTLILTALDTQMHFRVRSSDCDGRPMIFVRSRNDIRYILGQPSYCRAAYGRLVLDERDENTYHPRGIGPFSTATVVE
jgi:hypothetical protein